MHTNHSTANALLRSERPANAPHNCSIMSSQQSTPTAHATPLTSPGEARGVACAVGVDCWEDIMLQLCALFVGRSLRRSAFAVL